MKITIENLKFDTIIGILDFERENEQKIIIDILIEYPFKKDKFVDYAKVVNFTINHIKEGKFYLLEDALDSLILNIKKLYPQISYIKTSIKKPQILQNCVVGAILEKKF